jgi:hypothetical protein
MILLARVRSSLIADKQRANTASPIKVTARLHQVHYQVRIRYLRGIVRRTSGASVKSSNGCPLASAFLPSLVQDLSNEGNVIIIVELQDIRGDLNEEGIEDTLVPLLKYVCDLLLMQAKATLEDVISFGD